MGANAGKRPEAGLSKWHVPWFYDACLSLLDKFPFSALSIDWRPLAKIYIYFMRIYLPFNIVGLRSPSWLNLHVFRMDKAGFRLGYKRANRP
jgi:hypothetical protein